MLNGLTPETFLADYWQKQPLFLAAAIDIELPALDPNELAWLATQPDVESRLVFTERAGGIANYRVEHGPFTENDLSALPNEDWTLLVQDVEKHLPDFRGYFRLVPFIPSWRIDDLMVSFAAPGGSVGPHKDNYDVFLCQGEGSRNWLVSNDRTVPNDSLTTSLSLLKPFEPTEEQLCHSGDVLYVPPAVPHWGIAKDHCTTYSIGMRAPTKEELVAGFDRIYAPDREASKESEPGDSLIFYSDPDLRLSEARQGKIAIDAVRRIREQNLLDNSLSDEALMTALGSVITDPKAWLDPDKATAEEVEEILHGRHAIRVHGMALLAWCDTEQFRIVFANGAPRKFPVAGIELVRALCDERVVMPDTIQLLNSCPEGPEFVYWLLAQGVLDTS